MGRILEAIASWMLRSLKVEVSKVHQAVDMCDKDRDGYISIRELIDILRAWVGDLK